MVWLWGILLFISCASVERERDDVEFKISPEFKSGKGITFALMSEVEDKGKSLSKDLKASIYDFAILELMKVKNLEIVDRKDIDKILSEQEFSSSGFVGDYAPRIGKLLRARAVGFFSIVDMEREGYGSLIFKIGITLGFKIVDVETGKILYYSVSKGEGADYNEAVKVAVKKCIKPLQEI